MVLVVDDERTIADAATCVLEQMAVNFCQLARVKRVPVLGLSLGGCLFLEAEFVDVSLDDVAQLN